MSKSNLKKAYDSTTSELLEEVARLKDREKKLMLLFNNLLKTGITDHESNVEIIKTLSIVLSSFDSQTPFEEITDFAKDVAEIAESSREYSQSQIERFNQIALFLDIMLDN